jgi:non-ribosomal peptide synthetase component F
MDMARMLTWTAYRYPDRKAVGGPELLTYRQGDARTNQLARALARLGVRPGDEPDGELTENPGSDLAGYVAEVRT